MDADAGVSDVAAAIAEPARTRMLYCLMDGRARTSTELAVVAGVTPATASVQTRALKVTRQGWRAPESRFGIKQTSVAA